MTRILEATLLALGLVFTVGATLGIAISAIANGSIALGVGSVALQWEQVSILNPYEIIWEVTNAFCRTTR